MDVIDYYMFIARKINMVETCLGPKNPSQISSQFSSKMALVAAMPLCIQQLQPFYYNQLLGLIKE